MVLSWFINLRYAFQTEYKYLNQGSLRDVCKVLYAPNQFWYGFGFQQLWNEFLHHPAT
jgi:hypothetical protein